ncbi:hypothetical protein ACQZV8_11335 [Magnetococcales bacterium HHB-1]
MAHEYAKRLIKWKEFIINFLDSFSKIVGGVAAVTGFLAIVLPAWMWNPVEAQIARLYGIEGWVYYEIAEERTLTDDGGLSLLKSSEALYTDIKVGDKLRAGHAVNFRQEAGKKSLKIFVMNPGSCVIVTSPPKHEHKDFKDENVISGGWLRVVTTACGIFR